MDVDPDTSFTTLVDVPLPARTRKNGTLFLHTFLTSKSHGDDWDAALRDRKTTYASTQVTQYIVPAQQTFNLIRDNKESTSSEKKDDANLDKPVTHLYSRIFINILDHREPLPKKNLPSDIAQILISPDGRRYLPVLHIDLLGSRLEDLVPVNKSTTTMSVTFIYAPISFGKLRLWLQFAGALQTLRHMGFTEKDADELKGLFSDTNIVLLCVTFVLLFDFLAFKNDIYFWRNRQDMVGLSSRTLVWRAFSQFVVFLYLMDENTSLLVVIPAAIGTIIELWKVTKAFRISIERPAGAVLPRLLFGTSLNREEAETEEYDSLSMKYLSYILYPLCVAGAVYSLLYTSHRSWYSWLVQSVVNGVYAFGFLFMLPQLFVNYKLKSVAHLPWRAFMYKAFNTFIDDIFAFIITMPTAHRVACFRDDIVFLIYLYQRWLYPVDKKRVNEFGSTGDETSTTDNIQKKDQ
nr:EOG090X032C [Ilyocryptus agilis]